MGWFIAGFAIGRLLFTPFMLRILAIGALLGLAGEARYGVHERFMYWLTYRHIYHDHSALVRFIDLNEPWMSWSAGVLYALIVVVMLVFLVRLIKLIPVVLEIALSGVWRGAHFLVDALGQKGLAATVGVWHAVDNWIRPPIRVALRKRVPEVLQPLPLGSPIPRHVSEPQDQRRAS